jgi:hypothetical protein
MRTSAIDHLTYRLRFDEHLAPWRNIDFQAASQQQLHADQTTFVDNPSGQLTGRATPFGLFASFGIGNIGDETELAIGASDRPRRHVRLDMEYLVRLAEALERDPDVRARIVFRANASMYEIAGRIHLPALRGDGDSRRYELIAIEPDSALRTVLDAARNGG